MLKERVLSAIVLIALVLCALFLFTPFYFALALGFVADAWYLGVGSICSF